MAKNNIISFKDNKIAAKEPEGAKYQQFVFVQGDQESLLTVNKDFAERLGYGMDYFKHAGSLESIKQDLSGDLVQDSAGDFSLVPEKDRARFKADLENEIQRDEAAEIKKFADAERPNPLKRALTVLTHG